jgi:hypothetical protein
MLKQPIEYQIPLISQGLQDCLQASVAQILDYFDILKTVAEIKNEVPVHRDVNGVPLGTSIGHIGSFLLSLDLSVTMHILDIQIFDRTWSGKSNKELVALLLERAPHLHHELYDAQSREVIVQGYVSFLQLGGEIRLPILDVSYLYELLTNGPLIAVVNYNFLNDTAKTSFDADREDFYPDPIAGNPSTHAVVVAGYSDGRFLIVDPDSQHGGHRWIDSGRLIGAIYLAQTEFDNLLISVRKNK